MQPQVTRLYRAKAVAAMFDVSVSTIYRAIEAGRLEALKVGAGRGRGSVRIPEYALRSFEAACAEAAYPARLRQLDGSPEVMAGGAR